MIQHISVLEEREGCRFELSCADKAWVTADENGASSTVGEGSAFWFELRK